MNFVLRVGALVWLGLVAFSAHLLWSSHVQWVECSTRRCRLAWQTPHLLGDGYCICAEAAK